MGRRACGGGGGGRARSLARVDLVHLLPRCTLSCIHGLHRGREDLTAHQPVAASFYYDPDSCGGRGVAIVFVEVVPIGVIEHSAMDGGSSFVSLVIGIASSSGYNTTGFAGS